MPASVAPCGRSHDCSLAHCSLLAGTPYHRHFGWYDTTNYGLYLSGKSGRFYGTQPIETVTLVVYDGMADRACVIERDQLSRQGIATPDITCLGDTVWQRSIPYEPIPVPVNVVDSARDSRVRPVRNRFTEREVNDALYIPTHWPPVSDGFAGADSSLWLRGPALRYTVSYMVFDYDGTTITRIGVPKSLRILWADQTSVWARELDEDDVPTLRRFAIVRSSYK